MIDLVFAPEEQHVYSLGRVKSWRSVGVQSNAHPHMSLLTERTLVRRTLSYEHAAPPEQET